MDKDNLKAETIVKKLKVIFYTPTKPKSRSEMSVLMIRKYSNKVDTHGVAHEKIFLYLPSVDFHTHQYQHHGWKGRKDGNLAGLFPVGVFLGEDHPAIFAAMQHILEVELFDRQGVPNAFWMAIMGQLHIFKNTNEEMIVAVPMTYDQMYIGLSVMACQRKDKTKALLQQMENIYWCGPFQTVIVLFRKIPCRLQYNPPPILVLSDLMQ